MQIRRDHLACLHGSDGGRGERGIAAALGAEEGGCGGAAVKAQLSAEPEGQSLPLICLFRAECVGGIAASLELRGYLASRRPVGAVFPASPDWTHAGDH